MSARRTLAVGLVLVTIALGVVLSRSPVRRVGTDWHPTPYFLAVTGTGNGNACQSNETLPAGTTAIRLALSSVVGARVTVQARAGKRVLTSGAHAPGWTGDQVTIPVHPVPRVSSPVTICFSIGRALAAVAVLGTHAKAVPSAISVGRPLGGAFRVDYLAPGHSSWWSRIPAIARRIGLGRAWAGTWVVGLLLAMMGSALLVFTGLVLREQG